MKYDIDTIIDTMFNFSDLKNYGNLRPLILNLKTDLTQDNINEIKEHIDSLFVTYYIKHHINIRLEMLEDILSGKM